MLIIKKRNIKRKVTDTHQQVIVETQSKSIKRRGVLTTSTCQNNKSEIIESIDKSSPKIIAKPTGKLIVDVKKLHKFVEETNTVKSPEFRPPSTPVKRKTPILQLLRHQMETRSAAKIPLKGVQTHPPVILQQCHLNSISYFNRIAKQSSDAAMRLLPDRFKSLGMDRSDLDQMLRYIANRAPLIIHIDLKRVLPYLVEDTHYRMLIDI